MVWRSIVTALAVVAAAPNALAQTRQEFTFERVIRLGVGDVAKAEGSVQRGDVVLSFPYEYRRTGVLQNDVRGAGAFALRTLYAAAGTPGFMVGEFTSYAGARGSPVWCFQRPDTDEPESAERIVCFLGAWPLRFGRPPLVLNSFSINPSHHPTATVPEVEEGPVELPFELRLEFRMRSWERRFLVLDLYGSGERINLFRVPRAADGSATLPSVAGSIRFVQENGVTTATPLEASSPEQSEALGEIADMLTSMSVGASVVESPLIAVAPPETTEYLTFSRNEEVMRQQMRAQAPIQLNAAPNGNAERFGDAGTLLYRAMRGNFEIYCRPPPPRALGERLRTRLYCLEDTDNDGALDTMWPNVGHADINGAFVASVTGPTQRLRNPITFTEAPNGEQPEIALRLRYRGPSGDRRNDAGEVVASTVTLSWVLAENVGDVGPSFDFQVRLSESGEGQIVTRSGAAIGRVRNVDVSTGTAEILIDGGLPVDQTTYLSGRSGMLRSAPRHQP